MDSREILPGTEKIRFLLDIESFGNLRNEEYTTLEKLVRYTEYDRLNFLRTPGDLGHDMLEDIKPLQFERRREDNRQVVHWEGKNQGVHSARYVPGIYEDWVDTIDWNAPGISVEDLELADLFSELLTRRPDQVDILVTCNESILKNRRLLEYCIRRHHEGRMHMMTPSEAGELAGIYMRRNDDFIFYMPEVGISSYEVDFTHWYWTIPRVFVQHYSAGGEGYLGSMLDRFESLFICIDKLGEQYYRGTGNHTDLMTRYHFNHGISLLTGTCDVLALHSKEKYDIEIPDRRTNLRTGKYPLLKELKDHNEDARLYVLDNHEVIELLHTVRNDIIHQSGVIKRGPGFSFREHDETTPWESQTLWMSELDEKEREKFNKHYQEIDDEVEDYDPVTKWGVVTEFDEQPEIHRHTAIEPYRFLKQATKEIAEFADEYLHLLGHPNRVRESPDAGAVKKADIDRIADYGLHPFL
jgi:hypothetical protein